MKAKFSKLLLLPRVHPTESLRAYMFNTAKLNAYPRLYAGRTHEFNVAWDFLNAVSSHDRNVVLSLWGRLSPLRTPPGQTSNLLLGKELIPTEYVRIQTRHVCPLCLEESPWSRGEWELKATAACPFHGVKLVNKCSNCDRNLTWAQSELLSCYCGQSLCELKAVRASSDIVSWARKVRDALRVSMRGHPSKYVSKNGLTQLNLSKLLLMSEIVKTLLIPFHIKTPFTATSLQRLTGQSLTNATYRAYLWESIFLYAAADPMQLEKKLRLGQTTDELRLAYEALIPDLCLPTALKQVLPQQRLTQRESMPDFDKQRRAERLQQLHSQQHDEHFDPFAISSAKQEVWDI